MGTELVVNTVTSTWDRERGRIHMIGGVALEEREYAPPRLVRDGRPREARPQVAGRRGGVLYRYFDEAGILLYVGVTVDASSRECMHRASSAWRIFANTISRADFDDIKDAEQTERWVIGREQPIFNKSHNQTLDAQDRLVVYLREAGRLDLLPQLSIFKMGTPDGRGHVKVRRIV